MKKLARNVVFLVIVMIVAFMIAAWGAVMVANAFWLEPFVSQEDISPVLPLIALIGGGAVVAWTISVMMKGKHD